MKVELIAVVKEIENVIADARKRWGHTASGPSILDDVARNFAAALNATALREPLCYCDDHQGTHARCPQHGTAHDA